MLANKGATAMIDISDGLLADARHLAFASNVVLELDAARIPCGPDVTTEFALRSGEEYELLATVPAAAVQALLDGWSACSSTSVTIVGKVVANDGETLTSDNALSRVLVRGHAQPGESSNASSTHVEFNVGHDHFSF